MRYLLLENNLLRFVNILHSTNLNEHEFWMLVKKLKRNTLMDKSCAQTGLYTDNTIINSFNAQMIELEQKLNVNSSKLRFQNITREKLRVASEMFIYLNTCPGNANNVATFSPTQIWFKSWYKLYDDLFGHYSPDLIILTLNRIMKATTLDEFDFQRNQKIFRFLKTLLKLKYEEFQRLMPGYESNSSMSSFMDYESIKLINKERKC